MIVILHLLLLLRMQCRIVIIAVYFFSVSFRGRVSPVKLLAPPSPYTPPLVMIPFSFLYWYDTVRLVWPGLVRVGDGLSDCKAI